MVKYHDSIMYQCTCGQVVRDDDLVVECIFYGSLEEPPEYTAYCPHCGINWERMEELDHDET